MLRRNVRCRGLAICGTSAEILLMCQIGFCYSVFLTSVEFNIECNEKTK